MALDELKDDDSVVSVDGIELLLAKKDEARFPDSIIDYEDSHWGRGLVVRPDYYSGGCC